MNVPLLTGNGGTNSIHWPLGLGPSIEIWFLEIAFANRPTIFFKFIISKRPTYCASEHSTCINGPGWYECNCITPYVGNGNYCEYFNHCYNDFSTPCHETALCEYGPVFPQGNVRQQLWIEWFISDESWNVCRICRTSI